MAPSQPHFVQRVGVCRHASIGASAGFGLPIIGRLLGHASTITTQRYARLADDPVRRASEAIGDHLKQALGAKA